MTSPAADLASATRLFLARHAEALASGEGARTLEACEGLLAALEGTLPAEIAAARRLGARSPPEPDVAALADLDEAQREAWAHAVLERRIAETEGILLQLQLTLRNLESGRGDAFRLVALITAARSVLRGLEQAMERWAAALAGEPAAEPAMPAWAGLRAAREALLAGAPDAAAPALRRALWSGLAAPLRRAPFRDAQEALAAWDASDRRLPVVPEHVRALERALDAAAHDAVVAWALVDEVDALVNRAATARPESG